MGSGCQDDVTEGGRVRLSGTSPGDSGSKLLADRFPCLHSIQYIQTCTLSSDENCVLSLSVSQKHFDQLNEKVLCVFRNRATELETQLEAFSVQYLQGN